MARLGVKPETLYSYVSRGLVRRVPGPRGRVMLYVAADIERLKARHDARAGHAAVAAGALRWGEPVIDSAITSVGELGLRYRGREVVPWARAGATFEAVAEHLWRAGSPADARAWRAAAEAPWPLEVARVAAAMPADAPPLACLCAVVPLLAACDPARFAAPAAGEPERARARLLIARMAAALALPAHPARVARAQRAGSVAAAVVTALAGGRTGDARAADAVRAVDLALVLCADHELNVSAFAARVAASAGSDLYACVSAALAALSGPRHGGMCDRVEALCAEAAQPERARAVVLERLRRGEAPPGFGHRLYPAGDPRAQPLLDAALALAPAAPVVRTLAALVDAARGAGLEPPTVDIGLVAVAAAAGLPAGSAAALFAVGRAAGWIAHVFEQRESAELLRPRARYTGP